MHEELANPPDTTHGRKRRLEVVYRRIEEIKPDPRNPRHHSRKQIKQLARLIETFGFTVPALVDREDNVIVFFFSSRRRHTRSCLVSWAGDVYKRQRSERRASCRPRRPSSPACST